MKQLAAFFLVFSFFPAGCQKIDGSANQTVQTQNADRPAIIKICLPVINSQSSQIKTRKSTHIVRAEFINPNKIWVITHFGEIYSTADAGETWKKLQLKSIEYFKAFDFFNEQRGWLADTDKNVWKTTDGGENWNRICSFKALKGQDFIGIEEIKFTSATNGWLHEVFNIFHTTDGGKSWKMVNQVTEQPHEMFFTDDLHGWISFKDGSQKPSLQILRTADGGQSWKKSRIQTDDSTEALYFLDDRKGWLSDAYYGLFVTADAGESWLRVDPGVKNFQTRSVFWLNSAQGWLAGAVIDPDKSASDVANNIPTILSTTDGGKSWNKFEMPGDERFFDEIRFTDSTDGWLTSQNAIYKMTDGGKNWKTIMKIDFSCP